MSWWMWIFAWLALSIPASLFIGACIAHGMASHHQEPDDDEKLNGST